MPRSGTTSSRPSSSPRSRPNRGEPKQYYLERFAAVSRSRSTSIRMGDTEPPREKSRSRSRSPPRENGDRPKEGGVAEFGGQGGERKKGICAGWNPRGFGFIRARAPASRVETSARSHSTRTQGRRRRRPLLPLLADPGRRARGVDARAPTRSTAPPPKRAETDRGFSEKRRRSAPPADSPRNAVAPRRALTEQFQATRWSRRPRSSTR